jgi:multidrug efflux pump subunit AcrB
VHQRLDGPALSLQMDRTRLQQYGLSASNVGQNVLIALSGSSQTAPAFWLNPQNGVVYNIAVQSAAVHRRFARCAAQHPGGAPPQRRQRPAPRRRTQLLGNLVDAQAGASQLPIVSRYNIAPVIDVYVSVQGTDLASVAVQVRKLVDEMRPKLSRGSQVAMRGQVQTMQSRSSAWAWAWRWPSCWCTC